MKTTRIFAGPHVVELVNADDETIMNQLGHLAGLAETEGWDPAKMRVEHEHEGAHVSPSPVSFPEPKIAPPPPTVPTVPAPIRGVTVDAEGAARSLAAYEAAKSAGFAPKMPRYKRGTMVIDIGVANAEKARRRFDDLDDVPDGADKFVSLVKAEQRTDTTVKLTDVAVLDTGHIQIGDAQPVLLERGAFDQYCARLADALGIKSPSSYLGSLDSADTLPLRAHNLRALHDALRDREATMDDAKRSRVKLRARSNGVYAVTGKDYPTYDADLIALAIKEAAPNMKLEVAYDGAWTRFDLLAHSPVLPEKYVAGEYYQAGICVITDDRAQGAIRVSAELLQNLCVNLYILDHAKLRVASIRHKGDVRKLAAEFKKQLGEAKEKIAYFLRIWGYAVDERLDLRAKTAEGAAVTLGSGDELMEGVFRSLIQRHLVPIGARASNTAVPKLVAAYQADTSAAVLKGPSRGAVVNAITRYAHEQPHSPREEYDLEVAATRLLVTPKKTPLLWAPPSDDDLDFGALP